MTMELKVFNLQKQPMEFDNIKHPTLNLVGDFLLVGVEFDHKELMSCMYETFYAHICMYCYITKHHICRCDTCV